MTTPTPANPYAPKVMPVVQTPIVGAAIPLIVSPVTPDSVIATGHARSVQQNALARLDKNVSGGSKSKSKRSKRSKSKRPKRSKSKRASSKRYKRGGAAAPTATSITPKPSVVSVPQFAVNVGASANSGVVNQLNMKTVADASYDDINATPSNTKLN